MGDFDYGDHHHVLLVDKSVVCYRVVVRSLVRGGLFQVCKQVHVGNKRDLLGDVVEVHSIDHHRNNRHVDSIDQLIRDLYLFFANHFQACERLMFELLSWWLNLDIPIHCSSLSQGSSLKCI